MLQVKKGEAKVSRRKYDSERPVRSKLSKEITSTLRRQSVFVFGERGIGKSFIARDLERLPASTWETVRIPAGPPPELLQTHQGPAPLMQSKSDSGRPFFDAGLLTVGSISDIDTLQEQIETRVQKRLQSLDNKRLLLLIWDDFGPFVEMAANRASPEGALRFLNFLRRIRQEEVSVRMALFGTRGPEHFLAKMRRDGESISPLNDMALIQVPPLTGTESAALICQLQSVSSCPKSNSAKLSEFITHASNGIPLLIEEMANSGIPETDGSESVDQLPSALRGSAAASDFFSSLLEPLNQDYTPTQSALAQQIIQALSMHSDPIQLPEVVEQFGHGGNDDDVLEVIDLLRRDLIVDTLSPNQLSLRHPTLSAWLHRDAPENQSIYLHPFPEPTTPSAARAGPSAHFPAYSESHAVLIGPTSYKLLPPSSCSKKEIKDIEETIRSRCGFDGNILTLTGGQASRHGIMSKLHHIALKADSEARILIFFTGHSFGVTTGSVESDFLVPHDGNPEDLSSLIRIEDLFSVFDVSMAKHCVFIFSTHIRSHLGTCFPSPSLTLSESLKNKTRLAIAPQLQQPVPPPGRLTAEAMTPFVQALVSILRKMPPIGENLISAASLASHPEFKDTGNLYVLQRSGASSAVPVGDFIFRPSKFGSLNLQAVIPRHEIETVTTPERPNHPGRLDRGDVSERIRDLLSSPHPRVALDHFGSSLIQEAVKTLGSSEFALQDGSISAKDIENRLRKYDEVMAPVATLFALLCRWGAAEEALLLQSGIRRITESVRSESGKSAWINLQWYPVMLLLYVGGVVTMATDRMDNLAKLLLAKPHLSKRSSGNGEVLAYAVEGMLEVTRMDLFKHVPGHERQYTPESEYLLSAVQPFVNSAIELGAEYEFQFDRFEVLKALLYSDLREQAGGMRWGPPGRFGWKHKSGFGKESPFEQFLAEVETQGQDWKGFEFGLFSGSLTRYSEAASSYRELVNGLNWF